MRRRQCLALPAATVAMDVGNRLAVMARCMEGDVIQLKGTKIFVTVEEALVDVLVVSFRFGANIFQGALLDVTKKNSPFGVSMPWSCLGGAAAAVVAADSSAAKLPPSGDVAEEKPDRFHALRQRQTYFQQDPASGDQLTQPFFRSRKPEGRGGKDRNVRMRRLRPRQVLCSHCRAICNENSENVQLRNTTRKESFPPVVDNPNSTPASPVKNTNTSPTAGLNKTKMADSLDARRDWPNTELTCPRVAVTPTTVVDCVPKEEPSPAVSSQEPPLNDSPQRNGEEAPPNETATNTKDVLEYQAVASGEPSNRMILRKRRLHFVGEDGLVSSKQPKIAKDASGDNQTTANVSRESARGDVHVTLTKSPVIKISFANPQGKDTVVKIPARLQAAVPSGEDNNQEDGRWYGRELSDVWATKDASAKAAKKALKKAKKEAQKKAVLSPNRDNNNNGDMGLHRHKHHHHHHHHHKHKLKRKRRHRENENVCEIENCSIPNIGIQGANAFSNQNDPWGVQPSNGDARQSETYYEEVKNRCLKQKLSISLKRLNAKAYMRCSPKYNNGDGTNAVVGADSGSSGSGSECGDVPDFPIHEPLRDMDRVKPLMMRISTHNAKKCQLDNGREMAVGDIVWGKIHGFPWWPGKVLALTVSRRDNGVTINQQAHVAWFGSSTSSYMPCNQLAPFLNDFKTRYNKKKRGPYKEAIRQATLEAQKGGPNQTMVLQEVGVVS